MTSNDVFPGTYIKAADLGQNRPTVTIASITLDKFETADKPVLHFLESKKGLVLNKTNWNQIALLTGQPDSANWAGHKIRLYVTRVDMKGQLVDAVRVEAAPTRPVVVPPPAPVTLAADDPIPF
jgi:hypothetical protein